jgi:hypothetical protein
VVEDALLNPHSRAPRASTSTGDAFLTADTAIRSDIQRKRSGALTTFLALETEQVSGSDFDGDMPTCMPGKLGGPTLMLVGGKKRFTSHGHDLANTDVNCWATYVTTLTQKTTSQAGVTHRTAPSRLAIKSIRHVHHPICILARRGFMKMSPTAALP